MPVRYDMNLEILLFLARNLLVANSFDGLSSLAIRLSHTASTSR